VHVNGGGLRESVEALARFDIPENQAKMGLVPPHPLDLPQVAGQRFQLQRNPNGAWRSIDRQGNHGGLTFTLVPQGKHGIDPIALELVPAGSGQWAMSIDQWGAVYALDELLVAGTKGGLLTAALPESSDDPLRRHRAHQPGGEVKDLWHSGNEVLAHAKINNGGATYLQLNRGGASWGAIDARFASESLRKWRCIERYNPRLTHWKILSGGQSDNRFQVKPETTPDFVDVSLSSGGFGFDQVCALDLEPGSVILYTPDGRTTYARATTLGPPRSIEREYASTSSLPAFVTRRPSTQELVLLADDDRAEGWVFNGRGWDDLDDVDAVRAELRQTLWEGQGWTWTSNDTVTAGRYGATHNVSTRFDRGRGQLGFDVACALQARSNGELWAATDSGLVTWKNGELQSIELTDQDPFRALVESGGALSADFVCSLDGAYFLEASQAGAVSKSIFQFDGASWQPASNRAMAERAIADARSWYARGPFWRASRQQCENSSAASEKRTFEMLSAPNTGEYVDVDLLSSRLWDFETLHDVARSAEGPAVATQAGVVWLQAEDRCLMALAATEEPVKRIALEGEEDAHVQLNGGSEKVVQRGDRQVAQRAPSRKFAVRDAQLHDGPRWKIDTDAQSVLRYCPQRQNDPVSVNFDRGRFDFDRVVSCGILGESVLLATDHAFLHRGREATQDFVRAPGMENLTPDSETRVGSVWQGEESPRVIVDGPGGTLHQSAGAKWEDLTLEPVGVRNATRSALDKEIAIGPAWRVYGDQGARKRGEIDVQIDVSQAGSFELAYLDRETGSFTFDLVNDVHLERNPSGTDSLIVATRGGIAVYSLDGLWKALEADLDGNPNQSDIDSVREITRIDDGPIVRLDDGRFFHGLPAKWLEMKPEPAKDKIREALAKVHEDPDGWNIRQVSEPASEVSRAFQLQFQGEPVTLLDGNHSCFAHDVVRAVEWTPDRLLLATEGGILSFAPESGQAGMISKGEPHLTSQPFTDAHTGALRPITLRTTRVGPISTPLLRTEKPDDAELWYHWDPARENWEETPTGQVSEGDVLLNKPGFWLWRLPSRGHMELELDKDRFNLPENGEEADPFSDETFAFWNVEPARLHDGRPLAWYEWKQEDDEAKRVEGWFIGTEAGVLRISADGRNTLKVDGQTVDGIAMSGITTLGVIDGTLLARSQDEAGPTFQFDPSRDTWEAAPGQLAARIGENATVPAGWLKIVPKDDGRIEIRPRSTATDALVSDNPTYLVDGRFVFDRAQDFVRHDGCYWVATPGGLSRIDANTGDLYLYRRSFDDVKGRVRTTIDPEEGLVAVGPNGRAWYEHNTMWLDSNPEEASEIQNRYRTLARNPLFTCKRDEQGIITRVAPDLDPRAEFPAFPLGQDKPTTPLLSGGIFGFDEIRDAKLRGEDDLFLAARLGIWEYAIDDEAKSCLPSNAYYRVIGVVPGKPFDLVDLLAFRRNPLRPDEVAVSPQGGDKNFVLADGTWHERPHEPLDLPERLDDAVLAEWSSDTFGSAFATPTSIWYSTEEDVIWVRKNML